MCIPCKFPLAAVSLPLGDGAGGPLPSIAGGILCGFDVRRNYVGSRAAPKSEILDFEQLLAISYDCLRLRAISCDVVTQWALGLCGSVSVCLSVPVCLSLFVCLSV